MFGQRVFSSFVLFFKRWNILRRQAGISTFTKLFRASRREEVLQAFS